MFLSKVHTEPHGNCEADRIRSACLHCMLNMQPKCKASSCPAELGACGLTCCWDAVVPAGHRAHEVSKLLENCGAKDVDPFLTHRKLEVLLEKFGCKTPVVEVNLEH